MSGNNQCGYEAFASNMSASPYRLFNSLTTPSSDSWNSFQNSYDISTGNHAASANLGTDYPSGGTTVDGEYVAIRLPDKRKLGRGSRRRCCCGNGQRTLSRNHCGRFSGCGLGWSIWGHSGRYLKRFGIWSAANKCRCKSLHRPS